MHICLAVGSASATEPHFVVSVPIPLDASPAHPLGTSSPFSAPWCLAGFTPWRWQDLSVLLFPLYRNGLWPVGPLFFLFTDGKQSWCRWFFAYFLLSSALPWPCWAMPLNSSLHCLWTANKRTWAPSPTKQVRRSCNSQLWCNSHDCTLPYTLKIIQTIISKYVFHNSKKMHISFGLG